SFARASYPVSSPRAGAQGGAVLCFLWLRCVGAHGPTVRSGPRCGIRIARRRRWSGLVREVPDHVPVLVEAGALAGLVRALLPRVHEIEDRGAVLEQHDVRDEAAMTAPPHGLRAQHCG